MIGVGELCSAGLQQPGRVEGQGDMPGVPASCLGSVPQERLSTSSQTESTSYMCPGWRVMQLPTGSSAASVQRWEAWAAGMAKRARALPLLPFSHSPCPVLLLQAGRLAQSWSWQGQVRGGRGVLAVLLPGSDGQRQMPTPWCGGGFAQS